MMNIAKTVKSGDTTNREAMAASFYWPRLMQESDGFIRDRYGFPPNNYFNYGYGIAQSRYGEINSSSRIDSIIGNTSQE
ncbi:MAG: hypothetical protein R2771_11155 [Saprospiraceae bacterium]